MRFFIICTVALLLHAAILLFGGLAFNWATHKNKAEVREVEIVAAEEEKKKEPEKKQEVKKVEETPKEDQEAPPDNAIAQEIEALSNQAPALAAVSLSDLESALGGFGGADSFGSGTSFASGGVIGGTGAPGSKMDMETILGTAETVEQPRVMTSLQPSIPPNLRKGGGNVVARLYVNDRGRVDKVIIEKSSNPLLEPLVTDALMKWVFEPSKRDGKPSPSKVLQSIRIPPA
jgi:outer membrane biosynthesis protein TonB